MGVPLPEQQAFIARHVGSQAAVQLDVVILRLRLLPRKAPQLPRQSGKDDDGWREMVDEWKRADSLDAKRDGDVPQGRTGLRYIFHCLHFMVLPSLYGLGLFALPNFFSFEMRVATFLQTLQFFHPVLG